MNLEISLILPCLNGVLKPCPSGMTSDGGTGNCYTMPGFNGAYGGGS